MNRPSLFVAASVAAGILAGPLLAFRLPRIFPLFLAAAFVIVLGAFLLFLARRERAAWPMALLAWCLLGAAAAAAEPMAVPARHVSSLIAAQRLDLTQPLRWRGRLRADPLRLPWGLRYVVDLEQVQAAGNWIAVAGGLRANYYFNERAPESLGALASLRAGDRIEILMRAAPPRNYGDPGAFDYREFLARQDVDLLGTLRNAELVTRLDGPPPTLAQRIARLHGRLLDEIDQMLGGEPARAAVARAMLLGDRSFLDSDQIDSFQQTGAYHVLVVAGLHVGFLVAALLWLCRRIRLPLGLTTLVVLAGLAGYVAIVEDRPPIFRAALVATAFLLGRLLYRRSDLLNAIGLAAIVILLFRPSELRDASFLLSFLAALTIGGLAIPLLERTTEPYVRALDHLGDVTRDAAYPPRAAQFRLDLRAVSTWLAARLPSSLSRWASNLVMGPIRVALRLGELLLLSLAIQIGMLPLMAQYFHRISVVASAANLPAILLTGLIVPFGFAALLLSMITAKAWPGLAHALGYALSALVGILVRSIHWFARPAWISYRVPSPPLPLVIAFLTAGLALSMLLLWSPRRRPAMPAALATPSVAIVLFALGALVAAYPFAPRLDRGRLEITVIDVGQGDSIFVAFPDGRTMLVDGGGLPAVLRNFRVGQLWIGRDVNSAPFRELLATARARSVPVVHLLGGERQDWDGTHIDVLWPPDDALVKAATNDDSVVLRLTDARESLLLTGDIERPVEHSLVDAQALAPADFLKVPHHGGKTSSTEAFLGAVSPKYAAISVGASNSYGQPAGEVLDRIAATGARILRTDLDGAITATTDGQSLQVRTFLDRAKSAAAQASQGARDQAPPAEESDSGAAPID